MGTLQTLSLMKKLARAGSTNLQVRQLAVRLTNRLQHKDFWNEARNCLEFCKNGIRYVRDIANVETLHTCEALLSAGAGDCDDKAIVLSALLLSIGHKPRFIAVAFAPDEFCHVWVQDLIRGEWVDLEPTEPLPCGVSVPYGGAAEVVTMQV